MVLHLDRSPPNVDCCRKSAHAKEAWVSVVRLPLHLWSPKTLKKIKDTCVALARLDERRMSGILMATDDLSCFSINCGGKYNHSFLLTFRVMRFLVQRIAVKPRERCAVENMRVLLHLLQLEKLPIWKQRQDILVLFLSLFLPWRHEQLLHFMGLVLIRRDVRWFFLLILQERITVP